MQNVGDAVAFVTLAAEQPPRVVLQPSGGPRRPAELVRRLGDASLGTCRRRSRRRWWASGTSSVAVRSGRGTARRLEMLWFGQPQEAGGWTGRWSPPFGGEAWKELTMRRLAITGGYGFLGWHIAVPIACRSWRRRRAVGREPSATTRLAWPRPSPASTSSCTWPASTAPRRTTEVEQGNVELAPGHSPTALATAGARSTSSTPTRSRPSSTTPTVAARRPPPTISARPWRAAGGRFADVLLPNLFGEHGRPRYNSFVATFAHEVADGRDARRSSSDREVPLLHAQDAARA